MQIFKAIIILMFKILFKNQKKFLIRYGKSKFQKLIWKQRFQNGTTKEILDKFVGHFEETSKNLGNIALAAHNRGYSVNYFEKLKELEIGDKVIYTYGNIKRTYVINLITVVKDTDWSNLKDTNDNRITLITCVENEPEYRRCLQAIEVLNN